MRIAKFASASMVAIVLAATLGSVTASGQSGSPAGVASAQAVTAAGVTAAPAAPTRFAALARVNAVPMTSGELDAVKGQHAHFVTPSKNNQIEGITGLQVVNRNNLGNWVDLGNGELVGPGYHGLCGAALNSPKMFIPGQNPGTGIGGGC